MATLSVQSIVATGLSPAFASAAAGGDEFVNDERTYLHVKNGDASPHTVTITKQRATVQGPDGFGDIALSDIAVAVPAGEERLIKAPPAIYNDSNGKAQVTYSAVTSVTVGVFRRSDD